MIKINKVQVFQLQGVASAQWETSNLTRDLEISLCAIITCHVATEEVVHHVQISPNLNFVHDCRGVLQ